MASSPVTVDFRTAVHHAQRMAAAVDLTNGRIRLLVRDGRLFRWFVHRKLRETVTLAIDRVRALAEGQMLVHDLRIEFGEVIFPVQDGKVWEIEYEPAVLPEDKDLRAAQMAIEDLLVGP